MRTKCDLRTTRKIWYPKTTCSRQQRLLQLPAPTARSIPTSPTSHSLCSTRFNSMTLKWFWLNGTTSTNIKIKNSSGGVKCRRCADDVSILKFYWDPTPNQAVGVATDRCKSLPQWLWIYECGHMRRWSPLCQQPDHVTSRSGHCCRCTDDMLFVPVILTRFAGILFQCCLRRWLHNSPFSLLPKCTWVHNELFAGHDSIWIDAFFLLKSAQMRSIGNTADVALAVWAA